MIALLLLAILCAILWGVDGVIGLVVVLVGLAALVGVFCWGLIGLGTLGVTWSEHGWLSWSRPRWTDRRWVAKASVVAGAAMGALSLVDVGRASRGAAADVFYVVANALVMAAMPWIMFVFSRRKASAGANEENRGGRA